MQSKVMYQIRLKIIQDASLHGLDKKLGKYNNAFHNANS